MAYSAGSGTRLISTSPSHGQRRTHSTASRRDATSISQYPVAGAVSSAVTAAPSSSNVARPPANRTTRTGRTEKPHYSANSRRTVRSIVSGILQQAVLHQAIASNPVRELERIESPKGHAQAQPRGLTPEERRRLFTYVDTDPVSVAADLPDLIRFAIGTGLRIGELCAVRWRDVNLEGIAVVNNHDMRLVPVVAVRQNVYPVKGKGLSVHGGKTSMALRIVPLPEFVADRLRLRQHGDESLDWPVFASAGRDGQPTYRWPSTLRRTVRTVRAQVCLDWMTPHSWRRTVPTRPSSTTK